MARPFYRMPGQGGVGSGGRRGGRAEMRKRRSGGKVGVWWEWGGGGVGDGGRWLVEYGMD